MNLSLKGLAKILSKLKKIENHDASLEQHDTPADIAAEILWNAFMSGAIEDKTIADLGAGAGILGIGALMLGARKVYFIEKSENAIKVLEENLEGFENVEIQKKDINEFETKVDTILQNPPFGSIKEHIDQVFLEKAMQYANSVYSFHKASTKEFILNKIKQSNFMAKNLWLFEFPLPKTQDFHKKNILKIEVICIEMLKN